MFCFNDLITFTRYSNSVVSNWQSGFAEITTPYSPAFLQVAVSGITTAGTLYIHGSNENNNNIFEVLSFSASATLLTSNKFKVVAGLTPSWGSFLINVTAANEQGEPIRHSTSYGPYPCSITEQNTFQQEGRTARPGYVRGSYWRVEVVDFEPQSGDFITTDKGVNGFVGDIYPALIPNFPTGWVFLVTENPG